MKPKNVILLVVAIGCGLVASYMTSRLLAERGKEAVPTLKVLVAKKKVPSFTVVKDPEQYFVEKEFPQDLAPKKAITSFEKVKDKRLNKVLPEDGVLNEEDLVDPRTDGMAAQMAPGERAIAIKVNAESLAGGFVLPGSRVDIVSTLNNGTESETKIILQNMLVLAVDTQDNKDPEKKAILGQTVTLSAKPEEAQRLALAQKLGELRLILRPAGDKEVVSVKPAKPHDLARPPSGLGAESDDGPSSSAAPPPVPPLPPVGVAAGPAPAASAPERKEEPVDKHTLTIINGDNVQKAVFTKPKGSDTWENGVARGAGGEDTPPSPRPAPPAAPAAAPAPAPGTPPAEGPAGKGAAPGAAPAGKAAK
jgi:pilus assembly protein CpaB